MEKFYTKFTKEYIQAEKERLKVIFLHQRNEWHNEATPLNVREP